MLPFLNRKLFAITPPGAIVDNTSWTTGEIDTAGYAFLVINVLFGAMDIAMAALKVTESDTAGSGHVDITGSVMGTANNDTGSASTLPSATADNTFVQFVIPLKGRKRYLDLVATGGDGTAGTYMSAFAELWGPGDGPRTAVEALGTGAQRMLVNS